MALQGRHWRVPARGLLEDDAAQYAIVTEPVINETPYAFSVDNAALYTGSSVWEILEAIRRGDVTPSYRGTKIRIKRSELGAWVDVMPHERP